MKSIPSVRSLLLPALLAMSAMASPAFAQINISIGIAPPPPQYEVVPMIAPGHVWAPGYWAWNGDRHIWMRGRPILQREGYRWEPDRWEQRAGGYYRHEGRWEYEKQKKPKKAKHGHDDNGHHGKGGKHNG